MLIVAASSSQPLRSRDAHIPHRDERVHAAQIREAFAEHAAIIEGIAVVRKHRREGFGSQIKAFCDSWTADHGAELILSIPTNEGARLLNEKAGYTVVPPDGYLTIKVFDAQEQPLHIPYADQRTQDRGTSMWRTSS